MSKLYYKDQYTSPFINYAISSYIREYDISKANINILLALDLISKDKYNYYLNMDKYKRAISIGYMLKDDKELNKKFNNGFVEMRKMFFEANDIQDHEVLSIKKDAIYLINKIPHVTKFDNIEFINKNIYTSFYKISRLEFYYFLDEVNKIEKLDIKGIDDNKLDLHSNYMLDFLKYIFETAQLSTIDTVVSIMTDFYKKYVNLELDVGYYRELNSKSKFNIRTKGSSMSYYADMLSNDDKQYLNIKCNMDILRILHSYYSSLYFSISKKR